MAIDKSVDQDGKVVDVFFQKRRDGKAAKRSFKQLLRRHSGELRRIVTDKLRSYGIAHREMLPEAIHNLFDLGRRLISAKNYRYSRLCAFASWKNAAIVRVLGNC